ncbi:MAG: nickel-dependent hydrogenase large subunit [Nanoarchaeota archaeon]
MKDNLKDKITGTEEKLYALPIGPQHPMYIEAENMKVHVDGETIAKVDINIGYMHRGIEELMQRRNYIQNIYLAERICGICSGVHSVTYCQAIENMLGLEIPERAEYIRTVILELERLHSHFLFLGIMGYEMGLDTAFMYAWKDREIVMDMLEEISGNRVNYGMPTIGGVRRDIPDSMVPKFIKDCEKLEKRGRVYANLFKGDLFTLARTRKKGFLPKRDIDRFSIVGPVARGSDVKYDMRKITPYLAYDKVKWKVISKEDGDVRARILVKALEIEQSVKILDQCFRHLEQMKKRTLRNNAPFTVPPTEGFSVTEAPRGELFYYIRSNGTDTPARVRIRTPTFVNIIHTLPIILKNQQLADLPVIVASIDPCFSCCDRVAIVDQKSGKQQVLNETELRRMLKE